MKKIVLSLFLGISSLISSQAQTFVDLNFENAVLTFDSSGFINATNAFPGWTVVSNYDGSEIRYDNQIGSPPGGYIGLRGGGNLVVDGNYTAYLQGPQSPGSPIVPVLSQTGLVPTGTKSLYLEGFVGFNSVLINGNTLALQVVSNPQASPLVYGVDISQYAGQTVNLSLIATGQSFFDDITFSPNAVPEPSTWSILTGGALMIFGCRRLRIFRR